MCRDSIVRRQTISVLRSYPEKEWFWNSSLIAEITTGLMHVEENVMQDVSAPIPEVSSFMINIINVDVGVKTVKLCCVKTAHADSREVITMEKVVK